MHAFVEARKLRSSLPGEVDDGTVTIGNTTINTTMMSAFFMGWAAGLQYKTEFPSDCLYSVIGLFNSFDYIVTDFANLKSQYNYFNLFFYEPTHIY